MNKILCCATALLTVIAVALPAASALSAEESDWKSLKKETKRNKIDVRAGETLGMLVGTSEKAAELYESSYGFASFDNLKLGLGVTAGGGKGVAVDNKTGEHTYMEMGTVGVGASLGAQKYQVIFLFQDSKSFRNFVDKGWQADASANAAAWESGVNKQTSFVNGVAIYQMTDGGLMLNADIAGTKYWKDGNLNE